MRPSNRLRAAILLLSLLASGPYAFAGCPDADGDAYCDLNVLFARFGRNLSPIPRGKIVAAGELFTDPGSGDVFDASASITFTATEGVGMSRSFTLVPTDCITLATGRIRCINLDDTIGGLFVPIKSSPNVWHFKVKATRLDIQGAFLPPVTVTITHGTNVQRRGLVDECRNSKKAMTCRSL